MQRFAARHQIILGEHLEPVDRRALGEDRLVVIDSQAETETERSASRHFHRAGGGPDAAHSARPRAGSYFEAFALAASHSAFDISR